MKRAASDLGVPGNVGGGGSSTGNGTPAGSATPVSPGDAVATPPLKKLATIPKRVKLREFAGCSQLKEYNLLEKLGEGTFGIVTKAEHRKTKEIVALKRILLHNEKDGFPITALREIKILKMLDHPNVIRLCDMTVERGDRHKKQRGEICMVTPYMDHDLCGLLDNPAVDITVPQIKCYFRQVLQGLSYLHNKGILHRDMKAANLLVNNHGIVQIADFGLARLFDNNPPPDQPRREYTNMVVTRWYRPPEILLGDRRYTGAADLWGAGCILAEMYERRPIMRGATDLNQCELVWQLCGTPSERDWPGWQSLPGAEPMRTYRPCTRTLEQRFAPRLGPPGTDLLSKLLSINHDKRPSAEAALDHEFFTTDPRPAEPEDLPQYEPSHEIDKEKYKQTGKAAAKVPMIAPIPVAAKDAAVPMATGGRSSAPDAPKAAHEDAVIRDALTSTGGRDSRAPQRHGSAYPPSRSDSGYRGTRDARPPPPSSSTNGNPSRDREPYRDWRSDHRFRDSPTTRDYPTLRDRDRDRRDHRYDSDAHDSDGDGYRRREVGGGGGWHDDLRRHRGDDSRPRPRNGDPPYYRRANNGYRDLDYDAYDDRRPSRHRSRTPPPPRSSGTNGDRRRRSRSRSPGDGRSIGRGRGEVAVGEREGRSRDDVREGGKTPPTNASKLASSNTPTSTNSTKTGNFASRLGPARHS
ncbi:serine/threonine protein kinase, CMGC, CDC2/CDK sub [Savitreella phatthalungensis]